MVKVEVVMDEKAVLAKRAIDFKLVKLSWALFFILIGASWILESLHRIDSKQMWAFIYAGSGGILLLLNMLRIVWNINISKFTVGLGTLGILVGMAQYYTNSNFSIWAAVAAAVLIIGVFMLFEVIRK